MLLALLYEYAIDQECEKYIKEKDLEKEVVKKIDYIYKKKGVKGPQYQGELPEGNNGLGLFLLGVTGDEVLPIEIYNKIKSETLIKVRGTVQADILKEDQTEYLYFFYRIYFKNDG